MSRAVAHLAIAPARPSSVTSTLISRTSAILLGLAGAALLFAADAVLPRLVPGFPAGGSWLGQLLGAAWLGVAALNWLSQGAILGGIYGRPVVLANAAVHFISALVLLKAAQGAGFDRTLLLLALPAAVLAIVYWLLLLRGPLARDLPPQPAR